MRRMTLAVALTFIGPAGAQTEIPCEIDWWQRRIVSADTVEYWGEAKPAKQRVKRNRYDSDEVEGPAPRLVYLEVLDRRGRLLAEQMDILTPRGRFDFFVILPGRYPAAETRQRFYCAR